MNRLQYFFILLFCTFFFFTCTENTKTEDFNVEFGFEYFPLEVGKYQTYAVDSVLYDIGPDASIIVTNSRTFVKHEISDTITDNLGRTGFIVERFERAHDSLDWVIKDVWTAFRTESEAEWIEENLRFIKMVFPVKDGISWNGNRFIDETTIVPIAGESVEVFKSWSYEVLESDIAMDYGNYFFDNVAIISQADSENLIELRESTEHYAKDVGLIFREMRILDTQCISECEGQSWEEKAEKGFILRQKIIDFN